MRWILFTNLHCVVTKYLGSKKPYVLTGFLVCSNSQGASGEIAEIQYSEFFKKKKITSIAIKRVDQFKCQLFD